MKKRAKLALVLLVAAAGGLIAFAGAQPEGYKSVRDLAASPESFDGREVQVKASVAVGSLTRDPLAFALEEGTTRLRVEWASPKPIPEHEAGGTVEGRNVVVTGALARGADGDWVLRATDMQVGCASKYEPAEASE